MKNLLHRTVNIAFTALICLFICAHSQRVQAQDYDGSVSLQTFYDELAPYGQWVNDAQYGYVWVPDAEDDFRPYYTQGHWVMTDYGNTWVSDYPWGWAAFHYGRWMYDNYYGWLWIPGTTWGPAWVSWRYSNEYCGWAPLSPGVEVGMSYGGYSCPDDWWIFIPPQYIYKHHYYGYWYGPRENGAILARTPFLNNTYTNDNNRAVYVTGPRAAQIEGVTNRPVPIVSIRATATPGKTKVRNEVLNMYHPMTVNATMANGARPRPTYVLRSAPSVGTPQPASQAIPPFRNNTMHSGYSSSGVREMPGERVPQQTNWNTPRPQMQQPVQNVQMQPRPQPQQYQPRPQMQPSSQGNIHVIQPTAQPRVQSAPRPMQGVQMGRR